MATYTKIDESSMKVVSTIPQEIVPIKVETHQYSIEFLKNQKIAVEGDLANVISRHATELAVAQANVDEVNTLLSEAAKLGIVNP